MREIKQKIPQVNFFFIIFNTIKIDENPFFNLISFKFDWKTYLEDGLFKTIAGTTLTDDEYFLVSNWDFISNASYIFGQELAKDTK